MKDIKLQTTAGTKKKSVQKQSSKTLKLQEIKMLRSVDSGHPKIISDSNRFFFKLEVHMGKWDRSSVHKQYVVNKRADPLKKVWQC